MREVNLLVSVGTNWGLEKILISRTLSFLSGNLALYIAWIRKG